MDIDKNLRKLNIKEIKAPENFEDLARITLKNIENLEEKRLREEKKLKEKRYLQVALLFLSFTIIFGFKDVIASVYNKVLGYENYFSYNSYFKELNEEGKIQFINEKVTFSNGKEILIEGLFYDGKYLTLFSREINNKELGVNSEKNFIGIIVENTIDNILSFDNDKEGNLLSIRTYNTINYLDEINIILENQEEEKNLNIKIDKTKVFESEEIEVNKEIVSNEVKVKMDKLRVSPNSITMTYSLTSENKALIEKIKGNKNQIFQEGISISFWLDIKGNEVTSLLAPEEIIELEDGIEIVQQIYSEDLRLDKMKNLKINLSALYLSENIPLEKLKEKEFYNEDLYIYKIDRDRNVIKYFSRLKGDRKKDKLRKYEIGPPNGYVVGDGEDINKEEILGENYKDFDYLMPMIDDLSKGEIILSTNKLAGVNLEDRTFEIDLKN